MEQSKLFGKRVRVVRKAAHITQEGAAEKARLNPKYLGEIERGEKRPSFEAILALGRALNVPPVCFFQFEKVEMNEKVLRKKIEVLLQKCDPAQLQQAHRILKALLEP